MSIGNDFVFWHGRRLFKNLVKLKSLHLANNNLALLPRDIFVDNINLEHLDLSFNRFQSLPLKIINLNALTSIVMTFNSISYLNKEERYALDMKTISNPVRIYLDGNVFACGCESRSSIMWLFETNVVLDNKGNYSCISEHGLVTTTSAMIDQIELLFRTCSGKLWLFIGLCGLTLMLATFLSVMLISRLKTRIIYWIFKVLGHNVEIPKRKDFEYDLFVLHADSEYQWLCYTMRLNLEEDPRRNIRLCLKERNILPGGAKAESIVECLYSSWKSVIILTPEFVADEWCIFAMRTAIYSISTQMPSRVIVLWEESMTVQLVPEELLAVLDERSIITFSWQVDNNDKFWHDLYKMIID
ncbi:toll-like receptor 4 [Gigantopelta aegis]|uniref:toll-like receptor 4 n=1 Tax=Gigantopelta aegis TaxID=1735272 RepID=UPI001B88B9D9|nr:toll-like receptor 4 [Gigantopelta aegis]